MTFHFIKNKWSDYISPCSFYQAAWCLAEKEAVSIAKKRLTMLWVSYNEHAIHIFISNLIFIYKERKAISSSSQSNGKGIHMDCNGSDMPLILLILF